MNWAPRHTRLVLVLLILSGVGAAAALTLAGLQQKVTYFYSPTEIKEQFTKLLSENRTIRIGGLVKEGSVQRQGARGLDMAFTVTDLAEELRVTYHGIPPDLFRDKQGIVAEGKLIDKDMFTATTLLAKHDENYMPPEVAKSLKGPMPKEK